MRPSIKILRSSPGYTLLEAALAISISMVILYAMYRATTMHYAGVETGREIAEQSQVVRAVMDRIRGDLRATFTGWQSQTTPDSSASSGSTGTTGATVSANTGSTSNSSSSQSDYDPPPGGVLGTDSSLTLAVYNSTEGLDFSSNAQSSGISMSDVRMVRYWVATDNSPAPDGRVGLVRERVHRIPDPNLPSDNTLSTTEVLAQEVQSIQVRYYDGSSWVAAWDHTQLGPPKAIDVQIQMLLPSTAGGVNAGNWQGNAAAIPTNAKSANNEFDVASNANKSMVTFRIVVAMPPTSSDSSASATVDSSAAGGS